MQNGIASKWNAKVKLKNCWRGRKREKERGRKEIKTHQMRYTKNEHDINGQLRSIA